MTNSRTKTIFWMVTALFFALIFFVSYSVGFVPTYIEDILGKPDYSDEFPDVDLSKYGFGNYRAVALNDIPRLGDENVVSDNDNFTGNYTGPVVEPSRIRIDSVGLNVPVLNPKSTLIKALDTALLSGSVRYPTSAKLNEDGNIFIFGHSSHLPIVKNKMFKAFNKLADLKGGEIVKINGGGKTYMYKVTSVKLTDANDALVDLTPTNKRKLTLSTCNSFGAKSSRYVVEAEFVAEL